MNRAMTLLTDFNSPLKTVNFNHQFTFIKVTRYTQFIYKPLLSKP